MNTQYDTALIINYYVNISIHKYKPHLMSKSLIYSCNHPLFSFSSSFIVIIYCSTFMKCSSREGTNFVSSLVGSSKYFLTISYLFLDSDIIICQQCFNTLFASLMYFFHLAKTSARGVTHQRLTKYAYINTIIFFIYIFNINIEVCLYYLRMYI